MIIEQAELRTYALALCHLTALDSFPFEAVH
jgi:hypothetical protein